MADGLELLGVGAVLIDDTGRVLHIGGRGRRLIAGWLRIVEDQLVADQAGDERSDLIGGAIAGRPAPAGHPLGQVAAGPILSLRALPFHSDEGVAQRLHAVIVIDDVEPSARVLCAVAFSPGAAQSD